MTSIIIILCHSATSIFLLQDEQQAIATVIATRTVTAPVAAPVATRSKLTKMIWGTKNEHSSV